MCDNNVLDRNKESITRGCWKFYNEGSHSKIHLIHFVVVVT